MTDSTTPIQADRQQAGAIKSFRNMLVGLTRTDRDTHLIRYAAMVARLHPAMMVRFLHVLPNRGSSPAGVDQQAIRQHIESEVASVFADLPPSVSTACEVLGGPLMDCLLSYAAEKEVDVIVVGHRPDHPPGGGALVRRLAMKAPCSVWIVPDDSQLSISRILVPIDFSETSAEALQVATALARLTDAECVPLHVYFNQAHLTYEEYEPIARGQEEGAYQKFMERIDASGVIVLPLFVEGANIAKTIHQVASEQLVDLKVMATRGRSRSAAILLGSVAEGVIIEARTPVLIVRHSGSQLSLLSVLLDRTLRPQGSLHFD